MSDRPLSLVRMRDAVKGLFESRSAACVARPSAVLDWRAAAEKRARERPGSPPVCVVQPAVVAQGRLRKRSAVPDRTQRCPQF